MVRIFSNVIFDVQHLFPGISMFNIYFLEFRRRHCWFPAIAETSMGKTETAEKHRKGNPII